MNPDFDRQQIRSQINYTIKKYEEERNYEKEQQQRQKLQIKKNILEHLINRQRNSNVTAEEVEPPKPTNPNFSYSFGHKQSNYSSSSSELYVDHNPYQDRPEDERPEVLQRYDPVAEAKKQIYFTKNSLNTSPSAPIVIPNQHRIIVKQPDFSVDSVDLDNRSHPDSLSKEIPKVNEIHFDRFMTESSRYGSYVMQEPIEERKMEYKPNVERMTIKNDQSSTLFPNDQFGPKPKSPIRTLPPVKTSEPIRYAQSWKLPESQASLIKTGSFKDLNNPMRKLPSNEQNKKTPPQSSSQVQIPSTRYHSKNSSPIMNGYPSMQSMPSVPSVLSVSTPSVSSPESSNMPPLKKIDGPIPLSPSREQTKSYGTFIHDDVDQEHIEYLRRKKIQQMEKKRQKRNEQRKKSTQQKSFTKEIPKNGSQAKTVQSTSQANSVSKYTIKKNMEDSDMQSNQTVHSYKSLSKISNKPEVKKPKADQPEQKRVSKHAPEQHKRVSWQQMKEPEEERQSSPSQTPKTVTTNKTTKTTNSRSIFQQNSNKSRQKSQGKHTHQPKIQPKQLKKTFTKQSNKKMMINAITNVCLPGQINRKDREKLLDIINNDPSEFLIFLFKEYSRKVIKGIYSYDNSQNKVRKIYGDKAPLEIHEEDVVEFYRYDSGARQFKILDGCKSFSYVVHGVFIK